MWSSCNERTQGHNHWNRHLRAQRNGQVKWLRKQHRLLERPSLLSKWQQEQREHHQRLRTSQEMNRDRFSCHMRENRRESAATWRGWETCTCKAITCQEVGRHTSWAFITCWKSARCIQRNTVLQKKGVCTHTFSELHHVLEIPQSIYKVPVTVTPPCCVNSMEVTVWQMLTYQTNLVCFIARHPKVMYNLYIV